MAVSPIAFRHNLRLPAAAAHAQASGLARPACLASLISACYKGTIAPRRYRLACGRLASPV